MQHMHNVMLCGAAAQMRAQPCCTDESTTVLTTEGAAHPLLLSNLLRLHGLLSPGLGTLELMCCVYLQTAAAMIRPQHGLGVIKEPPAALSVLVPVEPYMAYLRL